MTDTHRMTEKGPELPVHFSEGATMTTQEQSSKKEKRVRFDSYKIQIPKAVRVEDPMYVELATEDYVTKGDINDIYTGFPVHDTSCIIPKWRPLASAQLLIR